jgi:hypothetical protein
MARRYDEKDIFGIQSVRFPRTEFRLQNCVDAALQLRVSCHQFCRRRRHERNTKRSGVSNFIQTPSVRRSTITFLRECPAERSERPKLSPVGAYVGRLLGSAIPSPLQVNHDQFAPPTTLISAVKRSWMVTGMRISRTTGTSDAGVEPVTHASGASAVLPSVPGERCAICQVGCIGGHCNLHSAEPLPVDRPGLPTFSGWWSRMRRIMGSIDSQVPITFLITVGRCHEVLYDRRMRQRNSLSSNQFTSRLSPTDP